MTQRKTWTTTQDEKLRQLMIQKGDPMNNNYKWGEIAEIINKNGSHRTAKQCRQRWHNQLKPGIDNQRQWTKQQQQILFSYQQKQGNRWAQISKLLPGRTDNNIKNYFYSTLRKALRKVNTYLFLHKKQNKYRNVKQFKQQTLNKVLSVSEQKYQNKINLRKFTTFDDAQNIKKKLIAIQRDDQLIPSQEYNQVLVQVIDQIIDFNRNCKRKKGKKKDSQINYQKSSSESINEQFQQQSSMHYQYNYVEEQQVQKIKKKQRNNKKQNKAVKKNKNSQLFILKKEQQEIQEQQEPQENIYNKKNSSNEKKDSSLYSSIHYGRNSIIILSRSSSSLQKKNQIGISQSIPKPYFLDDNSNLYYPFQQNTHVADQDNFLSRMPVMQKVQTSKIIGHQMPQLWRQDSHIPFQYPINPFQSSHNYMPPMNNTNMMMRSLNASDLYQKPSVPDSSNS